jgi:hypothetical protein
MGLIYKQAKSILIWLGPATLNSGVGMESVSSDGEDTIEVIEEAPAAPRSKRMEVSSHPKEHVVATKVRAPTSKAAERPVAMATTLNHSTTEKAEPTKVCVLTKML